jgi:hypothetical protein
VSRVYLDLGVALLESGGAPDPEAVRSLEFLVDAGHEVHIVSSAPPPDDLAALARGIVESAPMRPDRRSWYLPEDVERCHGATARLRTVLIGAAPPPGSIHRCDAVARSVQAAAMEILAAEAMPTPARPQT